MKKDTVKKYLNEAAYNYPNYGKVAELIDDYHKKAERMEIDLHKKIEGIVKSVTDPLEMFRIQGAVSEVSEPSTYVNWKKLMATIAKTAKG